MQVIGKQRGFTLIEVMIVVAILGILAALAVPQYQTFTTRAKISEGLVLLGPVKLAVVEYYASHGRLPDVPGNNTLALLSELGLNVSAVSGAASGSFAKRIWWNNTEKEIRIKYGFAPVDDKLLYLKAGFNASGQAFWTCYAPGKDGIPVRYLPSTCRA
ncbi:pilin [Thiocapsa rosea]|uniref:Type IV pilus assembly protein PilA n=1 Tax=Thiocapsa rosea TaxID=69360 RepID=A0A495V6D6_9GAMM|nr:pilin [Thiocapsa rosea]RKT44260.1 type IV pilus assembly protein PilA [Thiocapsa rosea]